MLTVKSDTLQTVVWSACVRCVLSTTCTATNAELSAEETRDDPTRLPRALVRIKGARASSLNLRLPATSRLGFLLRMVPAHTWRKGRKHSLNQDHSHPMSPGVEMQGGQGQLASRQDEIALENRPKLPKICFTHAPALKDL